MFHLMKSKVGRHTTYICSNVYQNGSLGSQMHKIVEKKRVFDKKNFAKSLEWDNARHLSNIFKTRQFS